jgi:phosphatidylinositol-3-phosphatase
MGRVRPFLLATAALLALSACSSSGGRPGSTPAPSISVSTPRHSVDATSTPPVVPRFAHIVVVVEENRAYSDVIGSSAAPYINGLARGGALLTHSYAIRHPSEPNYLALFSGSTHGVTDDSCPHRFGSNNLGAQLRAHGSRFVGYAESLPYAGYLGCSYGAYARKHAPWTNFTDLPATLGKPMRAFPADYSQLPRLSFVVPNLDHDMHDGTVGQADTWLERHLGGYVPWARTHNSLLVVTWDEDDRSANNHIPTLLVGAHVRRMHYDSRLDHYTMLRTFEAACGLPAIGHAADRTPITAVWTSS